MNAQTLISAINRTYRSMESDIIMRRNGAHGIMVDDDYNAKHYQRRSRQCGKFNAALERQIAAQQRKHEADQRRIEELESEMHRIYQNERDAVS